MNTGNPPQPEGDMRMTPDQRARDLRPLMSGLKTGHPVDSQAAAEPGTSLSWKHARCAGSAGYRRRAEDVRCPGLMANDA